MRILSRQYISALLWETCNNRDNKKKKKIKIEPVQNFSLRWKKKVNPTDRWRWSRLKITPRRATWKRGNPTRINIKQTSITRFHRRGPPQETFIHPYKSLVAHAFTTIISEIPRGPSSPPWNRSTLDGITTIYISVYETKNNEASLINTSFPPSLRPIMRRWV